MEEGRTSEQDQNQKRERARHEIALSFRTGIAIKAGSSPGLVSAVASARCQHNVTRSSLEDLSSGRCHDIKVAKVFVCRTRQLHDHRRAMALDQSVVDAAMVGARAHSTIKRAVRRFAANGEVCRSVSEPAGALIHAASLQYDRYK